LSSVTVTVSFSAAVFRGPTAGVAGLTFLEAAVHRRLAAADLVIALCLGHGARVILSTPRGADDTWHPLATANFHTI